MGIIENLHEFFSLWYPAVEIILTVDCNFLFDRMSSKHSSRVWALKFLRQTNSVLQFHVLLLAVAEIHVSLDLLKKKKSTVSSWTQALVCTAATRSEAEAGSGQPSVDSLCWSAREGGWRGHEVRTDDARWHIQTDLHHRFNLWHGDVPPKKKTGRQTEDLVSAALRQTVEVVAVRARVCVTAG